MAQKPLTIPGEGLEQMPPVRHVWRAASSSRAGMFHYVFLMENGKVDCTCEGWRMNRKCWHTTQVMEEHELDTEFSVSLD